jgi:hypothetical protein
MALAIRETSVPEIDAYRFPDRQNSFPVSYEKFPVPVHREFESKVLESLGESRAETSDPRGKCEYSLYFPCLTGNSRQSRVRS